MTPCTARSYGGSLGAGAAWVRWPNRSSKPVRSCDPRLGRFDSGAAPLTGLRVSRFEIGSATAPDFYLCVYQRTGATAHTIDDLVTALRDVWRLADVGLKADLERRAEEYAEED